MQGKWSGFLTVFTGFEWLFFYCWVLAVFAWQVANSLTGLTLVGVVLPVVTYIYLRTGQQPLAYLRLDDNWLAGLLWGTVLGAALAGLCLAKVEWQSYGAMYFDWTWQEWGSLVLSACLVEEVFFRGFLLQHLQQRVGFAFANMVTALLFTLSHSFVWWAENLKYSEWLMHGGYVLVLGWMLGYAFRASRSLWTPIVIHGVNNTMALIMLGICN